MSAPRERSVSVNSHACRVWEAGSGSPLGYLAGLGGLPRWTPFLDRLAEQRRVVAPSLPGFPGATGHEELDGIEDWVTATLDLLDAAGLAGADLVGASLGGMLAAEVAAVSRSSVGKLVLIAPFGIYDEAEPAKDPFAVAPHEQPALLTRSSEVQKAQFGSPGSEEQEEWDLVLYRASMAAARLLWPFGDRGLRKRLHRISAPTLILWGSDDAILPASYAKRFADGISGPTRIRSIEGAGHLADLDAPDAVARAVLEFTAG